MGWDGHVMLFSLDPRCHPEVASGLAGDFVTITAQLESKLGAVKVTR